VLESQIPTCWNTYCLINGEQKLVSPSIAYANRGELTCEGFIVPFFGHAVHVKQWRGDERMRQTSDCHSQASADAGVEEGGSGKPQAHISNWVERVFGPGHETTYHHQLERFVADVRVAQACYIDPQCQR
jgi:hypothetical protein